MSVSGAAPVRRLPEALIDQIAAGEVVERPASVVKELVENALDAGAQRIRVEVRGGGRDWIAVSDDGRGMSADDARLALSRHATSKIASADDLHRIATYGFRGEALPAIASVSRLRLRTRPRGAPAAFELQVEDGRWLEERVVGGPEGTRVEVADLFAAVPARRKFLKTVTTEWGHVADWMVRSALARPDVHFDVCRDDRPALAWPAARDPLDRIAAVMSEDDAAAFVRVACEEGGAALRGFVSRPDRHRGTLGGVYWFVNRRPVRDRLLQHALVEIYRDLLPRGRFPVAVLFLDLPPTAVDVNVHPAKWEVRFGDPAAIHRLVRHAVRAAIAERRWVVPGPDSVPTSGAGGRRAAPVSPTTDDWIFARRREGERSPEGQTTVAEPFAGEGPRTGLPVRFGELRLLGQLLSSYLVLETKDGLLLMDQHAAHERVLYEQLRAEWLERGVASQGLLVPEPVALDPVRLAALMGCGDAATRLGFELDVFGQDAVVVRAVPALLAGRDPASLVGHLADEIAAAGLDTGTPRTGPRALEAADRIFASLACHGSRRQGERLDEREQRGLLEAVDAIPWAPTCPHGRPVFVPVGRDEIERRFGRR
jgi:DNA mismatch repair protein MutL